MHPISLVRMAIVGMLFALMSACVPVFWMEDAQTLGRGRWKISATASMQQVDLVGKSSLRDESGKHSFRGLNGLLVFYPKMNYNWEIHTAYGLTDRFDLGVLSSFYTAGLTGKYGLIQRPEGHAFSLGGRVLGGYIVYDPLIESFRKFNSSFVIVGEYLIPFLSWQTYAFYTHRFRRVRLTLQPGWSYFYIGSDKDYLNFGTATLGIHVSIPFHQHITLHIGYHGSKSLYVHNRMLDIQTSSLRTSFSYSF